MARYTLTPLNPHFGVEVSGIDLNEVTGDTLFPDIARSSRNIPRSCSGART
jgi:hypothetical protein